MNFKTTLFLLMMVVLVGVYFGFVSLPSQTTHEQEKLRSDSADGTAMFAADEFSTESVKRIEIRKGDEEPLVIEKDGGDWWQIKPVRFPLNSWSTDRIVNESAGLKYNEKARPGQNDFPTLDQVSLDPPLATVVLEGDDDKKISHTIQVGRKGLGGHGYVMIKDDPHVYVVKNDLHKIVLDDGVNDWRKKSLSGPEESNADQVVLTRNGTSIDLLKVDGNWGFGGNHSGRVARDAVSDLLKAVDGVYVSDFIADEPESLAIYGLDQPNTTIKIRLPAPKPAQTQPSDVDEASGDADEEPTTEPTFSTLHIGAPKDLKKEHYFGTYASSEYGGKVVFTISNSDVEKFDKSVDDLRDKRITPIKASDVTKYTIALREETPIELERSVDGWSFADPGPGYDADHAKVAERLDAIVEAKADAFTASAQLSVDPVATITITATGRSEPDVLRVFPMTDDDEQRLVLRNNETTGYHVTIEEIEAVFEPVIALRNRTVLDIAADDVDTLTVHHPDGTEYQFNQVFSEQAPADGSDPEPAATQPVDVKQTWALVGQERFEHDALDDLIDELLPLKAERWLETTEAVTGFSVRLSTVDDKEHTIVIDPDARTSLAEGTETRFEVSEDLVDALDVEFRYRTVLPITTSEIESITVTHDGKSLTVRKNEDGEYVGSQGEQIDESAAGGLFDTVASLRVLRFVSRAATSETIRTIEVQTKDDQNHRLVLTENGASLGDRAFTLEEDTRDKLEADLIEEDEDAET